MRWKTASTRTCSISSASWRPSATWWLTTDHPLISALALLQPPYDDCAALLASFRAQTWPYKELVIVNNAPSSFAAGTLAPAAEPNVFLLDAPHRLPTGMARNLGLSAANGQLIAQFDADCWHHPERLARQAATLTGVVKACRLDGRLICGAASARWRLESGPAPGSLLFVRPAGVDYGTGDKGEELHLLAGLTAAGWGLTTLPEPGLLAKFRGGQPARRPSAAALPAGLRSAARMAWRGRRRPRS